MVAGVAGAESEQGGACCQEQKLAHDDFLCDAAAQTCRPPTAVFAARSQNVALKKL